MCIIQNFTLIVYRVCTCMQHSVFVEGAIIIAPVEVASSSTQLHVSKQNLSAYNYTILEALYIVNKEIQQYTDHV